MVKFSSSSKGMDLKQQVVLPTYQLDSNLVLLPGIVYNITFSRFKAAALLSRYKDKAGSLQILRNLVNEYEFNDDTKSDLPATLSSEAVDGISRFVQAEYNVKNKTTRLASNNERALNEFDWLLLAIEPNLDKIKDPREKEGKLVATDILTVSRIIAIVDDTSNVRLTLQALTRGLKVPGKRLSRSNERLLQMDWNTDVYALDQQFASFKDNSSTMFRAFDEFLVTYRQSLSSAVKKSSEDSTSTNLLCLNPLANALFLQLGGSKEFNRAYASLQKLFNILTSSKVPADSKAILRLLDLTCGIIPFPNHRKLQFLNNYAPKDRFLEIEKMMQEMKEILGNLKSDSNYVNHWFYNEASNLQKANVVANQLKSIRLVLEGMSNDRNGKLFSQNRNKLIRRSDPQSSKQMDGEYEQEGLGEDEDDNEIRAIEHFIKQKLPNVTSLLEDAKRLIVKDFKRIKNSTPGNSDYHVLRNYLEIVVDIPWDVFVTKFQNNKDIDIQQAKEQLDKDHYGLENVKKRLIQYLVVLKLLSLNAKNDVEANAEKDAAINQKSQDNKAIDNSSFIIPDNDETSASREAARNKNKKARSSIDKVEQDKSVVVSRKNKSPIIMLSGPPGIGKTSLARSIAKSLGRNYQRISLGGIKDESEIRGHRRTYVGAMPGVIIQALRKAKSMNPVILLDEIDKVIGGANMATRVNGDPSAALLEVLDPEQNNNFTDHYLGFPVDLSQVIFICTANDPYNMSRPLLDRLEKIDLSAYDYREKLVIGSRYLLPRQLKRNGLPSEEYVRISEDVMKKVIMDYTREAGVRSFERRLGTICRYKAVEYAQTLSDSSAPFNAIVEEYDLPKYLGIPYPSMSSEIVESPIQSSKYGVVNGLSYNSEGSGSVLVFESIGFSHETSKSSLNMTGRLGEVLMESANIGLTFIKLILFRDLLNTGASQKSLIDRFNKLEIHLHVPLGAISKDGPSAGITMALLFLSLILEKPVPYDVAMTGEITLRGFVLPIGGLKEKLLGAHMSGIKRVIAPRENRKDLIEEYVKSINDDSQLNQLLRDNESKYKFKMTEPEDYFERRFGVRVTYASEFWDVIQEVWGESMLVKVDQARMIEYHI